MYSWQKKLTAADNFRPLSAFSVQNWIAFSKTCLSGKGDKSGLSSD